MSALIIAQLYMSLPCVMAAGASGLMVVLNVAALTLPLCFTS